MMSEYPSLDFETPLIFEPLSEKEIRSILVDPTYFHSDIFDCDYENAGMTGTTRPSVTPVLP